MVSLVNVLLFPTLGFWIRLFDLHMLQELEEAEMELDLIQKEGALQESLKDSEEGHQLPHLASNISVVNMLFSNPFFPV